MASLRQRPVQWLQHRSLRERIGGSLAVLVFLLAAVLGGLIGQSSVNQARARVGQSLSSDARRLAERLNTEMASRARELSLLASTDLLQEIPVTATPVVGLGVAPSLTPALAHTQSLLDGLKRSVPSYLWIAVADPFGRVLASTDPTILSADISNRSGPRDGFRPHGASAATALAADPRAIDLVQPIRAGDSTVVGVIAAQLGWGWVRDIERAAVTADDDAVVRRETFLLNNQDIVLMGPPGSVGQHLTLPVSNRARAGFYGASIEPWPDGESFLTGTAMTAADGPPPGQGAADMRWVVLVRQAEDVAYAAAYDLREAIWLAGLAIALSFALVGWLLAGMITAPLARIAAAAERLRQGDDVEIPRIRGPAEIDSLSASLRALVATLTRKQVALDEMEELALRDPLTGLLNRHGLRLSVERLLMQAHADRSSLMVFVGDLDGFKAVNDTLGHAGGDLLLCQVARRLARSVRASDVVARLGGDEFVLALSAPAGAADVDARAVALRAQAAIAAPYEIDGALVRVGCSLGGACWPDDVAERDPDGTLPIEFDEVLERADAALYDVKRSGKGRMMLHGERPRLARTDG
jgi:diguanylate cyclase (GGDEF)-like protein